jgi:hypothetical protein
VEIFNDGTLPTAYKLLDGANNLLSPLYSAAFLNRFTIWKYVLAGGTTGSIVDNGGVFHFPAAPAGVIYSLTPIPMAEQAQNFALTVSTHNYSPIACASPQRLINYTNAGDTFSCSEIFLNY